MELTVVQIVGLLVLILFFAWVTEALVEYVFGKLAENVPSLSKWKWVSFAFSLAVGLLCAFVYQFDIPYILGQYVQVDIAHNSLGMIVTGLSIGRGSNFIHELIKKFFPPKE